MSSSEPSPAPEATLPATDLIERLVALIGPEPIGENQFVIDISEHVEGHLFGGLVAAQALHAAYRTVAEDRRAHSAHAYFLRRGRPELPIEFEVHRDTDGRSFSARRVAAMQEGMPIFTMVCSFHVSEESTELLQPMPDDVEPPEAMGLDIKHSLGGCFEIHGGASAAGMPGDPRDSGRLWVRAVGPLPDDPMLHDCLRFYASDLGSPWNTRAPAHLRVMVSLDHAVWLHRRTRMDEWHYLDLEALALMDARGFYTGTMWHVDGSQVASIAQENLVRRRTD